MLPNYPLTLILAFLGAVCCQSSISSASEIEDYSEENTLRRASDWVIRRRNSNYHWGHSTPLVLLALSRIPTWNATTLESRLSIQQLDVDFLFNKLKGEFSIGQQILLTQTLTSLCRNVTDYYGYNLPKERLISEESDFSFAMELLTACGGNTYINKKHADRLMELFRKGYDVDKPDTMAMVVMATECLRHRYENTDFLLPSVKKFVKEMTKSQLANGSFDDNVISTALFIQAVQTDSSALEVEDAMKLAVQWLRAAQKEDGSFGNLMNTVEAIMALSPMKGRIHLDSRCVKRLPKIDDFDFSASLGQIASSRNIPRRKSVHVHIWIEGAHAEGVQDANLMDKVTKKDQFNVTLTEEASIYQILKEVDQSRDEYKFEFKEFPHGHYIVSINGYKDESSKSWMVYRLPSDEKMFRSSDRAGSKKYLLKTNIDGAQALDGETILLWYKQMH